LDLERSEEWYELWDEDAVINSGTPEEQVLVKGKAAIRTYYGELQKEYAPSSQHLQLTELIKVDGDKATALNYQLIFGSKDGVNGIEEMGVRRWTFVKKNGKWLIKSADLANMADKDGCLKLMPANW
jgi:ketosteroid isomerase-like protein